MAEFWEQMKLTLYFMRLEDKYWGLLIIGLFVLFYLRRKETKGLLIFACAASLVCICPPTAYGLSKFLPAADEYYRLWHIVPAGVVVCVALTLLFELLGQDRKRQVLFALGVFALLFFAGEFAYTSQDAWNDDTTHLGREETAVYELLLADMQKQGMETAYLWGPQKVMADSRIYSVALRPIYGKDIASEESDYSNEQKSMYQGYETYAAPDSPIDNKEEQVMAIANCLNVFPEITCDYVVLVNPAAQGSDVDPVWIFERLGYAYVGETETFQIFRRL